MASRIQLAWLVLDSRPMLLWSKLCGELAGRVAPVLKGGARRAIWQNIFWVLCVWDSLNQNPNIHIGGYPSSHLVNLLPHSRTLCEPWINHFCWTMYIYAVLYDYVIACLLIILLWVFRLLPESSNSIYVARIIWGIHKWRPQTRGLLPYGETFVLFAFPLSSFLVFMFPETKQKEVKKTHLF